MRNMYSVYFKKQLCLYCEDLKTNEIFNVTINTVLT